LQKQWNGVLFMFKLILCLQLNLQLQPSSTSTVYYVNLVLLSLPLCHTTIRITTRKKLSDGFSIVLFAEL